MRTLITAAGLALAAVGGLTVPVEARDPKVPQQFQRLHPCPATGHTKGACPGWQRDHIVPLCRGGADIVANMNWLTVEQHKLKTRGDCRTAPGTIGQ